jgi:hypothetical protein
VHLISLGAPGFGFSRLFLPETAGFGFWNCRAVDASAAGSKPPVLPYLLDRSGKRLALQVFTCITGVPHAVLTLLEGRVKKQTDFGIASWGL